MTTFLFIVWLFVSSSSATEPTDPPCTAENPNPTESCNIVWGT